MISNGAMRTSQLLVVNESH